MSRKIGLVLDCHDPEALAAFWAPALGYNHIGSVENYALLLSDDGASPKLLLQRVPEDKTIKNRMHLDIEIADVDAEVERLEGLGAKRLEAGSRSEHGTKWVIMTDPEGNEFCVCDGGESA
ncbi:MAG TPA: VOC family protein [Actinomycetota bacterium]|jgi:predicted enzyme related to lactoylglutathione lyase|nr:VOC family protein [Actinomycetota bacterium]